MNLQQLQTQFSFRADDTIAIGDVTTLLNLALQDVFTELGNNQNTAYRTVQTTNTVASQANYTLPTGFIRPIKMWVDTTEYSRIDYEDSTNTGLSNSYYIDEVNDNFVLVPAPTGSNAVIKFYYEKDVTELSSPTDEPPFPARFHEILILGALRRYYENQKEFGKVSTYQTLYDNLLGKLVQYYTRYSKDDVIQMKTEYDQSNTDF